MRFLACAAVLAGCNPADTEDPTDTEDSTDTEATDTDDPATDTDDPAPACETIPVEDQCGTWLETDEGDVTASNDEAVACVVAAASAGRSFGVSYDIYSGGGQYDLTHIYRVSAEGVMSEHYSGYSDICTVLEEDVSTGVDLQAIASCDSWECISSALGRAEHLESCQDDTNCDGV